MNGKSTTALRIIQVSDCHVSADPQADYRGQNADHNLMSLLPAIRLWQPDLILVTGDVSEDGSAASYGRVSALLGMAGSPVLALPGNHDEVVTMKRYFPQGPWDGPFQFESRGWQVILLDSTERNRVSGVLSPENLARLKHCLQDSSSAFILVALHHQPVAVNAQWIDRFALEEPERFFRIIDAEKRIRAITWGHVHQDFRSSRGDIQLLGSPSTVANSLPDQERFTLDLEGPACRWLKCHRDGVIETGLIRAGQSSAAGSTSQRIR
jgi:Icc protein